MGLNNFCPTSAFIAAVLVVSQRAVYKYSSCLDWFWAISTERVFTRPDAYGAGKVLVYDRGGNIRGLSHLSRRG
ncbi:hypothetical protein BDV29DRAFT_170771 [Aspergillus leporis]|uniref:Uncharacterized protein n=1 Tax=Aspergillus leporis TaxID=41062 RepID=A0A5N5X9T2_9EURO|nr:hypothetical protein BDV29DRAFT_170771 [Aspergillus leporis]